MSERSGIALNAGDSGWPVAAAAEAQPHKDGTGADPHPKATTVVDGTVHAAGEAQRITVVATGGTFTATFSGQTTSALAYNLTAAQLRTALEALSNIAPGDVVVNLLSTGVYEVYFSGALTGDQPQMTADGTNLTGPGHAVTVDTVATV